MAAIHHHLFEIGIGHGLLKRRDQGIFCLLRGVIADKCAVKGSPWQVFRDLGIGVRDGRNAGKIFEFFRREDSQRTGAARLQDRPRR